MPIRELTSYLVQAFTNTCRSLRDRARREGRAPVRFTALKAVTAALLVVPLATPAAMHLLESSSAATAAGVQNYTTPQRAGCPTNTASPSTNGRWTGSGGNTTYDARGKTFSQSQDN